jgi:hypothetical protein
MIINKLDDEKLAIIFHLKLRWVLCPFKGITHKWWLVRMAFATCKSSIYEI